MNSFRIYQDVFVWTVGGITEQNVDIPPDSKSRFSGSIARPLLLARIYSVRLTL